MSSKKIKNPANADGDEGKIAGLRRRLRNALKKKEKDKVETEDEKSIKRRKEKPAGGGKDAAAASGASTIEEKSKRSKNKKKATIRKRNVKEGSSDLPPSNEGNPATTVAPATATVVPRKKLSSQGDPSPAAAAPPKPSSKQNQIPPIAPSAAAPNNNTVKNSRETSNPANPTTVVATVVPGGKSANKESGTGSDGENTQSCSESVKKSTKVIKRPKKSENSKEKKAENSKDKEPTVDGEENTTDKRVTKPGSKAKTAIAARRAAAAAAAARKENATTMGAVSPSPGIVQGKNAVTVEVEAAMGEFVKNTLGKGVAGLRKEFAELKVYTATKFKFEAFTSNGPKNRYKDVVCLDSSRVVLNLNVPPDSDYIHANMIKLDGSDRSYIATQGPLDSTISDFWRLVHQEAAASVVMLCKCIEEGKKKCAQYFPDAGNFKNFGCMFVNNKRTDSVDERLLIHTVEALPDGCSNSTLIKLLQMTDWPDRGVPDKPMSVLRLLRAIPPGLCIIHCSAGVGRTGTVILIDAIIGRLLKGQNCNVKEMFQLLRNQRASAVQTEAQYILIHTCVLEYIKAKMPGQYKESAATFAEEVKNAKMV